MKVLHLIRSLDPRGGGPAEGLRQMCAAAALRGIAFEVATLDAPAEPWLDSFPVRVHGLGPGAGTYGYASRLLPWLQAHKHQYDAVVVHGLWQYHGRAAWRALRGDGPPYYVYPHGMLGSWFKRTYPLKHLKKSAYWHLAESKLIRDARAVLFTTREEARLAPESFSSYCANPMIVGYGTQTPSHIATGAGFIDAFPELAGKRLVLSMSRLDPMKGCDLSIEAFAQVADRDPSLHLAIAGPDLVGLRPRLEALVADEGLASRVTFTGMLAGDLKWGALCAAEVFLLPSHFESFGLVVAEALSVGLPVLISNQVAIWTEIEAAGAGFVADDTLEGTCGSLTRWLATSARDRDRMRASAKRCFAEHFHIDAATDRLLAALAHGRGRTRTSPARPIHELNDEPT